MVTHDGVPSFYPMQLIFARRIKNLAFHSLLAFSHDLVHFGQCVVRTNLDLNCRLETGKFLDSVEVAHFAEGLGLKTSALRNQNTLDLLHDKRVVKLTRNSVVSNSTKNRRITVAISYLDLVSRVGAAQLCGQEQVRRNRSRIPMLEQLKEHKPRIRMSRIRSSPNESQLKSVVQFVLSGRPDKIWVDERVRSRNWAIVNTLVTTGIRQGELRQLKVDDINFRDLTIKIERRPDDPEDPRKIEPNAKTVDRIIPISQSLALILEDYLFSAGSDAAAVHGSNFVFLTHGRRSTGNPIDSKTVGRAIDALGAYLDLPNLKPHSLRSAWIQNLTRWAIDNCISDDHLDRLANYLGGWSYLSKSASKYRGDQLTRLAYEAGISVEEKRNG